MKRHFFAEMLEPRKTQIKLLIFVSKKQHFPKHSASSRLSGALAGLMTLSGIALSYGIVLISGCFF
jgi:hypothetical protein